MGTWRIVALTAVLSALCLAAGGFVVEPRSLAVAGTACLGCEAAALVYRTRRPDPVLSATLTAVAQMLAVAAAAGALSYAVAARGGALWDGTLASWDGALGLDWLAYAGFVDRHPWLARAGGLAYDSFQLQLLLVPLALGFTGRTRALGTFSAAFALAALAVVLVSGLMPALGAYPGLGVPPGRFAHVLPRDVYDTAATVAELRRGGLRDFSLSDVAGIITFPSFHTVGGVLVVAALWPVRALRWPVLALDAAMIAATPACGGHYFVDVLAGAATALAAVAAARALGRRAVPAAPRVAVPAGGDIRA